MLWKNKYDYTSFIYILHSLIGIGAVHTTLLFIISDHYTLSYSTSHIQWMHRIYAWKMPCLESGSKQCKENKISVNNCFQGHPDYNYDYVTSYTVCLHFSSTTARAEEQNKRNRFVSRWMAPPWHVPEWKEKKDREKLFIREHQLNCYIPFLTPLLRVPFISSITPFSHTVSFSPSTSPACYRPSSPSCLCLLPSLIFFLPWLKYEYFRAKELKGNNEMVPELNYTPFPE